MAIQPSLIKTIYLYIFSGVGLALFLFGAYNGIRYAVNVTQFDKYPLQPYEETQCTYPNVGASMAKPIIEDRVQIASPSAEEIQKQETSCLEKQDMQRRVKKTNDLTHSIAMLLLGTLVFIPHWKLARKIS